MTFKDAKKMFAQAGCSKRDVKKLLNEGVMMYICQDPSGARLFVCYSTVTNDFSLEKWEGRNWSLKEKSLSWKKARRKESSIEKIVDTLSVNWRVRK